MDRRLEHILVVILAIGFITVLTKRLGWWEDTNESSYYQYESERAYKDKETIVAYSNLLNKIWRDDPNYVELELEQSTEFITLDSICDHRLREIIGYETKE